MVGRRARTEVENVWVYKALIPNCCVMQGGFTEVENYHLASDLFGLVDSVPLAMMFRLALAGFVSQGG